MSDGEIPANYDYRLSSRMRPCNIAMKFTQTLGANFISSLFTFWDVSCLTKEAGSLKNIDIHIPTTQCMIYLPTFG